LPHPLSLIKPSVTRRLLPTSRPIADLRRIHALLVARDCTSCTARCVSASPSTAESYGRIRYRNINADTPSHQLRRHVGPRSQRPPTDCRRPEPKSPPSHSASRRSQMNSIDGL
jgi:hypothetical protein